MRHYCKEYDSEDDFPNKKINYVPINGGRIDNYHETKIYDDGKYIKNISIAKKVFDKTKTNNDIYPRNNYNSEIMEINENDNNEGQTIQKMKASYEINNILPINKSNDNKIIEKIMMMKIMNIIMIMMGTFMMIKRKWNKVINNNV